MADPTIIDAGTHIDGRIAGDADVTVIGRVDGEIELSETLTVAADGLVRGNANVREAVIEGAFDGEVVAQERIHLADGARVVGSIEAPIIQVDDGALFSGEVVMELEGEAPAPSRTRTERTPATTTTTTTTRSTPSRPAARSTSSTGSTGSTGSAAATATSTRTTTTTVVEEQEEEEPEPSAEAAESSEEAELPEMSKGELQEYTVKELREELRERDMQVSGTKDELIERLQKAKLESP